MKIFPRDRGFQPQDSTFPFPCILSCLGWGWGVRTSLKRMNTLNILQTTRPGVEMLQRTENITSNKNVLLQSVSEEPNAYLHPSVKDIDTPQNYVFLNLSYGSSLPSWEVEILGKLGLKRKLRRDDSNPESNTGCSFAPSINILRAGATAWQLRAHTALAEILSFAPSAHIWWLITIYNFMLPSGLCRHLYTCAHTHM